MEMIYLIKSLDCSNTISDVHAFTTEKSAKNWIAEHETKGLYVTKYLISMIVLHGKGELEKFRRLK